LSVAAPPPVELHDTTVEDNDIPLAAQESHRIIDYPDETGELLGIMLVVNNPNIVPDLQCWHEGDESDVINDLRIVDMLKYGMGMTPGEAETVASGRSQDPLGQPDPQFFYIVRYKEDQLADYLGDATRTYSVKFTPQPPYKYNGIAFYVKNTSTGEDAIIKQVIVRRRVETLPLQEIGEEVEVDEEGTVDTEDITQQPVYPAQPAYDYTWTPPPEQPITVPEDAEQEYIEEEF
jgi:hypothetical protein